jgi:hypothetical protein
VFSPRELRANLTRSAHRIQDIGKGGQLGSSWRRTFAPTIAATRRTWDNSWGARDLIATRCHFRGSTFLTSAGTKAMFLTDQQAALHLLHGERLIGPLTHKHVWLRVLQQLFRPFERCLGSRQ